MLDSTLSKRFKRDYDLMKSRGKDMAKLKVVIDLLLKEEPLPMHYRDHPLKGKLSGYRDCHIEADWVLIYAVRGDELYLSRTGTHSDVLE
jgi:mRNA interferase YafQ